MVFVRGFCGAAEMATQPVAQTISRPYASKFPSGKIRNRSCTPAQALGHAQKISWVTGNSWERILRYPGGQERRICYPSPAVVEEEEVDAITDSYDKDSNWWGIETYYYEATSDEEDDNHPRRARLKASTTGRSVDRSLTQQASNEETLPGLPSTPEALLRYVSSNEYKTARDAQVQLVTSSYKVLEGSPWIQTKPLYVLAYQQHSSEAGLTYTLRTRVQRADTEDQLTEVLGKRRADGSCLIRVDELRDGIVAFEEEADAHRFGAMLEADGTQARVAECDGHALFREARQVQAVVVLIAQCAGLNCHLPMPEDLASALRGQRSLEDVQDF